MPKFRKKPVVIEAHQFDGTMGSASVIYAWSCGAVLYQGTPDCSLYVDTLEGKMRCDPNDWVIRGVKGEFYPCKPDIFEATYEKVDE